MHLIAPDVLAQARGLSPVLSGFGMLFGSLIWLCGCRRHRFWVVIAVTVIGGLVGLHTGRSSGGHILAMGVLLAISAGLLATSNRRVFAFVAAGHLRYGLAASALFPRVRVLGRVPDGRLARCVLVWFLDDAVTSFRGRRGACAFFALFFLDELFTFDDTPAFAINHLSSLTAVALPRPSSIYAQNFLERFLGRWAKRRKKAAEDHLREIDLVQCAYRFVTVAAGEIVGKKKSRLSRVRRRDRR